MRFHVAQQRGLSNAQSPFRVVEQSGRDVEGVNRYLDEQRIRGVADSTCAVMPTICFISCAGG